MSIYNIPYTYQLIWSATNMKYYGVRYAKDCHPDDLWKTYFTSSIYVAKYVKEHGNPDIIQVRKTFSGNSSVEQARLWEHKVLRRMKVIIRKDYLNQSDSRAINPIASSRARLGVSPGNKGKPQSDSIKDKKRKPKPVVTCPHCGKEGGVSAMHRHHFDNCGIGLRIETLLKIKNINSTKGQRLVVAELRKLKKLVPKEDIKKLDNQAKIKRGWYQLPDTTLTAAIEVYKAYLSCRKVLNLGNLSE